MPDPARRPLPRIIQGGMGAAVSTWRLARAVSAQGGLGVVSGTAIERVLACRLQEGDPGGIMRAAIARFPDQTMARSVVGRWYRPDGLPAPGVYAPVPMFSERSPADLIHLAVVAAFVEITLARQDDAGVPHGGQVGINLLEKIQPPTLPLLHGAMLAGVDWVLMGAGIPREIPGHLDRLARGEPTALKLAVADGPAIELPYDPAIVQPLAPLARPGFLAVVASDVMAASLARSGGVDGFVVEGPTAGGHNAPPRGAGRTPVARPVYGERDRADLARMRSFGVPFWLAGGQAGPGALAAALEAGAAGVQIGTAFAFCRESGLDGAVRRRILDGVRAGTVQVITDGRASPTGFPFKTMDIPGSEGGRPADARERGACMMGYLRSPYRRADGGLGWRCPAEPETQWSAKGGDSAECADRRCLCQGLMSAAGHPHVGEEGLEWPLITAGDDLEPVRRCLDGREDYSAADVMTQVAVAP